MLVPHELRDEARKVVARAEAGEALEYETWRVRKDGSRVDVSLRIAPLRDSRGEIAGTVCVVIDISGRKIAAARLDELALRARASGGGALGQRALAGSDPADLYDYVARLVADSLGLPLTSILLASGESDHLQLVAAAGWTRSTPEYPTVSAGRDSLGGYTMRVNHPVVADDIPSDPDPSRNALLRRLGVKSAMSAIIRQDNQSLGVICAYSTVPRAFTTDDVNFLQSIANVLGQAIAKARAEREVERSERHFRSLIEGALDLVTLVDENAVFLFQSPAVERILGYTQQDMLGRSAFDFIHPDDDACVAERFRAAIEQPGATVEFELRFRHKSGAWLTLETSGHRLPDDLGPPRMVFNSRDVTERKRAQLELAKARDEALESSRLKSAFLANMSHEIRTPINVILGYKDLIADHLAALDDASQQGHLDAINGGGQRLLHTIQQILDVSRIEARAFEVHPGRLT